MVLYIEQPCRRCLFIIVFESVCYLGLSQKSPSSLFPHVHYTSITSVVCLVHISVLISGVFCNMLIAMCVQTYTCLHLQCGSRVERGQASPSPLGC